VLYRLKARIRARLCCCCGHGSTAVAAEPASRAGEHDATVTNRAEVTRAIKSVESDPNLAPNGPFGTLPVGNEN